MYNNICHIMTNMCGIWHFYRIPILFFDMVTGGVEGKLRK